MVETNLSGELLDEVSHLLSNREWVDATLTFSFPDASSDYGPSAGSYGSGEAYNGFASPTEAFKDQMRAALAMVTSLTGLVFLELTGVNDKDATLRIGLTDSTATGFAYLPRELSESGDMWFSTSQSKFDEALVGSYGFFTILHELGHALGLKHGHEDTDNGALSPEVDGMPATVMTYRSYFGAHDDYYQNMSDSFAQSYMAYDVAALQALYGVNWTTNASRTTYSWDSATGEMSINGTGQGAPVGAEVFSTLWDAGGRDILLLRNFNGDQVIDLRAGGSAFFSSAMLADLSLNEDADANIYFSLPPDGSKRALIEAVKTGSGDDTIIGNAADNFLSGGAGNDLIYGRGGDDKLKGNKGQDDLRGGSGADILLGGGGRDRLYGNDGDDILDGGSGRDRLVGGDGADTFVFNAGSNVDHVIDFEIGVDQIDVSDPGAVGLIDYNGTATLVLVDAMLILNGHLVGDIDLDTILV